jgi:alpha-N-acetylgalactosaminidase
MKQFLASVAFALVSLVAARNNLSRTPPMGWMSWEIFRCRIDCSAEPDDCISEKLYKAQADAMVSQGFLNAGYNAVHMDDCWERKVPPRDPSTNQLVGDPDRFPSGMKALGDYYHSKGIKYALYTAESSTTCGGYPASKDYEMLDGKTFAEWGVDYMKVDGCGGPEYYDAGYKAMGAALQASGRPIEYSCSWPAYINGENETKQEATFIKMINYGCNGWRNYRDIQCNWFSLGGIIDHWGDYGLSLQPFSGPGHWHDMDMLLIGSVSGGHDGGKVGERCVSLVEEHTQMAIWAISASPMIMGNDMRKVAPESMEILLNEHAIAISQDPLGQMGIRVSPNDATQVWARKLANGDVAVALYNRGDPKASGGAANDITCHFAMSGIDLESTVSVYDIWAKKALGTFASKYTATAVPFHGTAFLRLSPVGASPTISV